MQEGQMRRLEERAEQVSEEEQAAQARQRVRSVPLPPQLREEKKSVTPPVPKVTNDSGPASVSVGQAQAQAQTMREKARALQAQHERIERHERGERETTENIAEVAEATVLCDSCGNPSTGEFSFCTECGADLPVQGKAKKSKRILQHGIRDTRETLRQMAALHDGSQRTRTQTRRQTQTNGTTEETVVGVVPSGIAAISSFFIPGSGQVLNGQNFKGIWILIGWAFFAFLLNSPAPVMLIAAAIAALDAYKIAERKKRGEIIEPLEWDVSWTVK
jgi:TM2 domain-containing membrane protein YozV